jgi:hypothetical protein
VTDSKKSVDKANAEVQAAVDEEQEKGFHGEKVDPTPNEHYTVAGVVAGKPTPETDHKAHLDAHAHVSASRFPDKSGS